MHAGRGVGPAAGLVKAHQQAAQALEQQLGQRLLPGRRHTVAQQHRVQPALQRQPGAGRARHRRGVGVQQQWAPGARPLVAPGDEGGQVGAQVVGQPRPAGLADPVGSSAGVAHFLERAQQALRLGRRHAGVIGQWRGGGGDQVVAAGRQQHGVPVAGQAAVVQQALAVAVGAAVHHTLQRVARRGAVDDGGRARQAQLGQQVGAVAAGGGDAEPRVALGQQAPAVVGQRRRAVAQQRLGRKQVGWHGGASWAEAHSLAATRAQRHPPLGRGRLNYVFDSCLRPSSKR